MATFREKWKLVSVSLVASIFTLGMIPQFPMWETIVTVIGFAFNAPFVWVTVSIVTVFIAAWILNPGEKSGSRY